MIRYLCRLHHELKGRGTLQLTVEQSAPRSSHRPMMDFQDALSTMITPAAILDHRRLVSRRMSLSSKAALLLNSRCWTTCRIRSTKIAHCSLPLLTSPRRDSAFPAHPALDNSVQLNGSWQLHGKIARPLDLAQDEDLVLQVPALQQVCLQRPPGVQNQREDRLRSAGRAISETIRRRQKANSRKSLRRRLLHLT